MTTRGSPAPWVLTLATICKHLYLSLSILYYDFCRYASALDGDPGENTYLESPGFQVPACVTFSFSMFVSSSVS